MYSAIRKLQEKRANGEEGFTLIELLVVIIIIGILAAIAIPVFLNQRENAQRAKAQSDARNAVIAQETIYTNSLNAQYADTATLTDPDESSFRSSDGVTPTVYLNADLNQYCMTFTIPGVTDEVIRVNSTNTTPVAVSTDPAITTYALCNSAAVV